MKCLLVLLQLVLIFQIVLNANLVSSAKKNLSTVKQLSRPDTLLGGQRITSNNGNYYLTMQTDGNLVHYSVASFNGRGRDFPLWASGTNGKGSGPYRAVMRDDGYLTIYDNNNSQIWQNPKNGPGVGPFNVVMQDDGNMVIYDSNNFVVIASNTNGQR